MQTPSTIRLHLILLYMVVTAVASCSYIDPEEMGSGEDRGTEVAIECDAELQPQQWYVRIVDDNDSTRHYYSENGTVSVGNKLLSMLVYNTDMENIDIVENAGSNTTMAKVRRIDSQLPINGKPIAIMPDNLFSEYIEMETSETLERIVLSPKSRIRTFQLKLELRTKAKDVIGCRTALIDGMTESIDLVTLKPSDNEVALAVPVWLDDTMEDSSDTVVVAHAKMTTFGRAAASTKSTMLLTLQFANGKETTIAIDMTKETVDGNSGYEITKTIDIDDLGDGKDTGNVDVEDRENENTHINL